MLDIKLDPGAIALLQQGYRNGWQQYLASLEDKAGAYPVWDLCVLTASNDRQAAAYEAQIDARRASGLLPSRTGFVVISDPRGVRIGSGGATLRVLEWLADRWSNAGASDGGTIAQAWAGKRVLVIHSGGDSKRLPHCSAVGKLFARVPHELPDGRPSSLFDELLVSLSGLPARVPEGVLVASGDVLLLFDHLQLSFRRPGLTGVAALAPAELGTRHGVYVTAPGGRAVKAFLHKPSLDRMRAEDALEDGSVAIDTGLVWFDRPTAMRLLAVARELRQTIEAGVPVNLYGDLLRPLAETTRFDNYLAHTSDGPASPQLKALRRTVWDALRGTAFGVEYLRPALFVHFGTTREYVRFLRESLLALDACGWRASCASWVSPMSPGRDDGQAVLVSSYLARDCPSSGCIVDSSVEGQLSMGEDSMLAGTVTQRTSLSVASRVVVHQLPLEEARGFVTRVYGVGDDPRLSVESGGTFLGRPWTEWLAEGTFSRQDLWPRCDDLSQCDLWSAQLYPVCRDREASLGASLWLQCPSEVPEEARTVWRSAERVSLSESYLQADVRQIVLEASEIHDKVQVRRFTYGAEREEPARALAERLGTAAERPRRARMAADWFDASIDPWLPLRGYQALAMATSEQHWEDRAFSALARLVRAHTPSFSVADHGMALTGRVTVRAAARIDFGGGWTDTPPYSLENGGTVLNAAITLWGEHPIIAEATLLDEPVLLLESRDLDASLRPQVAGEILNYARPADPFSLLKAALVFRGIVPADAAAGASISDVLRPTGRGLCLRTSTRIPRGSGLGTSSILAGAVLQCLGQLLGQSISQEQLFDEVLCLEQMITTGGGWQDQIGGLVGGIKLIRTQPGLPQVADIQPVPLSPRLRQQLGERIRLVYTGQRRLAKDLLRAMMRRYMARDPDMVAMLRDIGELALAMRDALISNDLDTLGTLVREHWQINVRMDPGSSNPFIDALLDFCAPYMLGAKLAGAGGGGFAIVVTSDRDASGALQRALAERFKDGNVKPWPCTIAEPGMIADAET